MRPNFVWDPRKAAENEAKHGVSFEDASTVFGDRFATTIVDEEHSTEDEERFITIGMSYSGQTLVVIHSDEGDRIRIISARAATRRERHDYERKR